MKKIGIIGAMELEVETLKAHMTTTNITTKANMEFHEGTLNGTPVVIVAVVSAKSMPLSAYRFWQTFFRSLPSSTPVWQDPECRSGHRRYSDLQGCPAP